MSPRWRDALDAYLNVVGAVGCAVVLLFLVASLCVGAWEVGGWIVVALDGPR